MPETRPKASEEDGELTDEQRKQRAAAIAQERAEDLFAADLGVILNPAKVEVYRIGPEQDPTAPGRLNGHRILAGPVKLEGKLGTALAKALVDGASYDWESTAAIDCSPRPSVVVVFSGDDRGEFTDRVAVYFCFSCNRIDVQFRTPVFGSEAHFHPSRTKFVKLVKQMFPEDRFVKALREDDSAQQGSPERNAVPE